MSGIVLGTTLPFPASRLTDPVVSCSPRLATTSSTVQDKSETQTFLGAHVQRGVLVLFPEGSAEVFTCLALAPHLGAPKSALWSHSAPSCLPP